MSGRSAFALGAGAVLLVLAFMVVLRPALERGGWVEAALVLAAIAAILALERWLRAR